MDSPFGRLDEQHTSKIIGAIPDMAKQAVLLVYRAEVDQDTMRETLGSKLEREDRLDRVSSRHTNIVDVGAS
jgi:DNA sulfur modification protein DndD